MNKSKSNPPQEPPGNRLQAWRSQTLVAWQRLPQQRRSTLLSLVTLSVALALLLAYQWPRPAAGPAATSTGSGNGSGGEEAPAGPATLQPYDAAELLHEPAATHESTAVQELAGTAGPQLEEADPGRTGEQDPGAEPGGLEAEQEPGGLESGAQDSRGLAAGPDAVSLLWPVEGRMLPDRGYGWLYSAGTGDWRLHGGIDIEALPGAEVRAVLGGTVMAVDQSPVWGAGVTVDHGNGLRTRYLGLERVQVAPEQQVAAGDAIGYLAGEPVGIEAGLGPHLHLEVELGGANVDPLQYLQP